MMMDVVVKIPQETISKAKEDIDSFNCLRKEYNFQLINGKWEVRTTCGRYGNGYGVGYSCKENCKLRITDLDKCTEYTGQHDYKCLIQPEYYYN
ncbi:MULTISPECIES: hypothetical protein [Paenibacillus]|uniref:Uncharacterized protein n=2 Tax=Paenibacillus TaxID=44249 RepID=A0ABX2ZHT6_PAEPO|nr:MULTISPECIES: hypothetical protein [Paenibacillus]MDR6779498.1 hypothetical protein [Paenibacillus peoriae]ODA08233.1 hypothetical protein A7312_27900 [Paenibacillus polymyxa]